MTLCRSCGQPDCTHTDLEYAGLVPPRATETRPAMLPPCRVGRAAPEAHPPAPPVRPNNHGEANVE